MMALYDRPRALHPHHVALDANDDIYDLVRLAVVRALDAQEGAIQERIHTAITDALSLNDDLLLEYWVCAKGAKLTPAQAWVKDFTAYRAAVWHDRRTEHAAPLTLDGPTPLEAP